MAAAARAATTGVRLNVFMVILSWTSLTGGHRAH
jgi:hypothetical protein